MFGNVSCCSMVAHSHDRRAAVAVFGVELLKRFTTELVDGGFDPPRTWNGGRRALDFCDELGFPPEYAGFETGRRDPMVEVQGPVELKPLHDFQRTIAHRIEAFYAQATPDRGLLSLPTGAKSFAPSTKTTSPGRRQ